MIEAVRAGTIFARDGKQYDRWARQQGASRSRGLTGAALEAAVMSLAQRNPEYVVVGA